MEYLENEHGIFTNNVFTGQTADEVYQEWLKYKNKPSKPSEKERIEALEVAMLDLVLREGE